MARIIFENLTMKQAEVFADWYEGQGEQDASIWFEDRDTPVPLVDIRREDWLSKDKETVTVTIQCRPLVEEK